MPDTSLDFPWVLTATVRPDPRSLTVVFDERSRAASYAKTLAWAAQTAPGATGTVFAENSGVRHPLIQTALARLQQRGRSCEYHDLSRTSDPARPFQGKGWGEGRMLECLVRDSPLLARHEAFAKLTGRLRLVNHRSIFRAIAQLRTRVPDLAFVATFQAAQPRPVVNTQFFWARLDFFADKMADAYRASDDAQGVYLEHVFAERLLSLASQHPIYALQLPVLIDGVNGWNGRKVQARHYQWRLRLSYLLHHRGPALVRVDASSYR